MSHLPVLVKETINSLDPGPNQNFIDATIGQAGHAFEILNRIGPEGKLLGIDQDDESVEELRLKIKNSSFEKRLILVCGNFSDLGKIIKDISFGPVHGIFADLGFSSADIEQRGRGFSFLKNEPLIMSYGKSQAKSGLTAAEILKSFSEKELSGIFYKYGEERFSRQIAKKIVSFRKNQPINTTFQLVEIIEEATPGWYRHRKIHAATKTFQALRIAVNDELDALSDFLPQAIEALNPGGRIAVVSFHSLEDRIVKNFFKEKSKQDLIKILNKKVIKPEREELLKNPRSRSAKLRAAIKL